jgi:hypothetical protein
MRRRIAGIAAIDLARGTNRFSMTISFHSAIRLPHLSWLVFHATPASTTKRRFCGAAPPGVFGMRRSDWASPRSGMSCGKRRDTSRLSMPNISTATLRHRAEGVLFVTKHSYPMSLWRSPFEWVLWLQGEDAQTLLWQAGQWMLDPGITKEEIYSRAQTWECNARKAVQCQSWSVCIDRPLRVCLDGRLFLFDMRMREWQ